MAELTHFDESGNAIMVDVSEKAITKRSAVATGKILVSKEIFDHLQQGNTKKGDVFAVARVAGIMGAKKTCELIPLCHLLMLTQCSIDFVLSAEERAVVVTCTATTDGKTGVEMEALTGVQITLLTIYDMCKAIDKNMIITDVHLVSKSGGKSGKYIWQNKK